jgi:hypothetical protein
LADLSRYARAQAGEYPDVLSPELLSVLHSPRVDSGEDEYGYGWRITPSTLGPLIHHTGATPGYFAHVMLAPDGQAVVVVANAYSEANAPVLATIAENILLIRAGQSPRSAGTDPLLGGLPWILSAMAAFGLLAAVASWWRPVRRGLRCGLAAVSAIVAVGLWFLPDMFGTDLRVMRIWMPDAGAMLIGAITTWILASVLLIIPLRSSIALCQRRFHREPATGQ